MTKRSKGFLFEEELLLLSCVTILNPSKVHLPQALVSTL
jgi:hypothetical protein